MIFKEHDAGGLLGGAFSAAVDHSHSGQFELGFADLEKAMAAGANVPPPDHAYNLIATKISEVRQMAKARGEQVLFERICCGHCASREVLRKFRHPSWNWECKDCTTPFDDAAALKQLQDLSDDLQAKLNARPSQAWSTGIDIFNIEDIGAATSNLDTSSSDEPAKNRLRKTLKKLLEIGIVRPYVVPTAGWEGQLDELREHFPNFHDAIDECIEPSFAIAAAGGRARPAPMLLVGPPGAGKSFFASSVAGLLKTPTFRVDFASATAGSSLDGLAVHWGNSCPGEVFRTLAFGRSGVVATAAPVGLLDEIDKACDDARFSPLGALYSLLEVESAREFEDQSLPGLRIDASHIRWLGSANSLDAIPRPILSRMHVVQVQATTRAESRHLFQRIFAAVVKDTQLLGFDTRITSAMIEHAVENLNAREFKTRATMAIGRALAGGRTSVAPDDFRVAAAPVQRKIGF